jgi:hypothetical protein
MFESAKHAPFSRPTTLHLAGRFLFFSLYLLAKEIFIENEPTHAILMADMCKGKTKLKVQYIGGRGVSDAGCWSSAGDYFSLARIMWQI